jgi:ribulose-phosphate 3-epimerase
VVDELGRSTTNKHVAALREAGQIVLPSLLLCDFARLGDEISRLEAAGVKALHLDVMDGHFVNNLTYGPPIVTAVRSCTDLPLDVHLMISEPQRYLRAFHKAGADILTVHVEALTDPRPVLREIRSLGMGAGLALNPPTPLSAVMPFSADCDLLLVMSVMPGWGGQSFDRAALQKLKTLSEEPAARHLLLEVDGGVNDQTVGDCAAAGATLFVAGSAIFNQPDYRQAVSGLLSRAGRTPAAKT